MWTERDRAIAKALSDPETLAFLEKVFTLATQRQIDLKNKYDTLDDKQFGQLMKVIELSKKENVYRLELIKQIAKDVKQTERKPPAPK